MGKHSWTQGINDYSDMTFEEFEAERLMDPQAKCSATNKYRVKDAIRDQDIPASYEWNTLNVVTPPKNQGSCGSCWAFSTVGTL